MIMMTTRQQIAALRRLGLPYGTKERRRRSWCTFQAACTFGPALKVDGIPGPATWGAVLRAKKHGYNVSPHFHLTEFRCGCNGKHHNKKYVRVDRSLLQALERARATVYKDRPLPIISGYRCKKFNAQVGGIPTSEHRKGKAADVPALRGAYAFYGLGFHGLGYKSHGLVTHVDVAAHLGTDTAFAE